MDRVCHFEIPYSDKARIQEFYSKVFGWQIVPAPGDMPYSFMITTNIDQEFKPTEPGGINGGMYERDDDGASKTPVVVIEVESCEQRIKDVEAAGGSKIVGPIPIADMGIYAQVKDSENNIIGLWQPLGE